MTDTVRVPREPTEAMIEASNRAAMAFAGGDLSDADMTRLVWSAMLAASPQGEGSSADADTHRATEGAVLADMTSALNPFAAMIGHIEDRMDDLITRLEEAAEGSRELDAAIWYAVHEPDVDYPGIRTEQTEQGPREVLTCELGSKWADDVGRYTTSIDEAIALARRVLPGLYMWNVEFDDEPTGTPASARVYAKTDGRGAAPTPALALCIAILRANHKDKP